MTNRSTSLTTPRYVQSFSCIGDKCPITCCGGWRIQIDRSTFEHWQTIKVEPLGSTLRKSARLTPPGDAPSPTHPAHIALTESEHCPLLTPEQLCSVHSQLGEAALPQTCRSFPRVYARTAEHTSMHCSLGCPEAARLALTDPRSMDLASAPQPAALHTAPIAAHRLRRTPGAAGEDELNDDSIDCVQASAEIFARTARHFLSRPEFNATQSWNLFFLAAQLAMTEAQKATCKREAVQAIERELTAMTQRTDLADFAQTMQRQSQTPEALHRLLELGRGMTSLLDMAQGSSFARGVLPRAFAVFGCEQGNTTRNASAARLYAQAEMQWFEPFDRAHPHLLKNVVRNDIGLNNFPTADLAGLTRQTLGVGMRLSMVRLFVIGRAALARERFGVDDYVEVVTSFSRLVEKDRRFRSTPFFSDGAFKERSVR